MYTVTIYRFKHGLTPENFTFHFEGLALQVARGLFCCDEIEMVEVWDSKDGLIFNRIKNFICQK